MAPTPNTTTVLDQLLEPLLSECITPDVAKHLANYKADAATLSRLDELAVKSTEGELTEAEVLEYQDYVQAIDLISILQLKAKKMLNGTSTS